MLKVIKTDKDVSTIQSIISCTLPTSDVTNEEVRRKIQEPLENMTNSYTREICFKDNNIPDSSTLCECE